MEEPVQEPVAWMYEHDGMVHDAHNPPIVMFNRWSTPVGEPYTETPLYTALAQPAASGEPVPLAGMSEINRTIAYCAAAKLREIGYKWGGRDWVAPQPAPARVPLTDEQINQITAEQWGRGLGAPYAAYRAYARAVEAAHGITGEPS